MSQIDRWGDRLEELPINMRIRGVVCFLLFAGGAYACWGKDWCGFAFLSAMATFFLVVSFLPTEEAK